MADNVGYTPGTGAEIAADEISGVLHQRVKITLGSDGVSDGDLSSSNPLPITASSPIPISAPSAIEVTASANLPVETVGNATVNVSTGELVQVLEAMRMALHSLTRTVGMMIPDTGGRTRVLLDQITGGLTLGAITSVTGVVNVQTAGSSSYNLNDAIPSLMHLQADNLRRNITVS